MTAQVRETISVDGEQRSLCVLPLAPLFRSWRPEPRFMAESSANWRGYRGSWEIVGTDLFLTDFTGTPVRNDDPTESGLTALPVIAPGPHGAGNEEAAERWKKAVAHLEGLPKDDHGESMSDQAYWPIRGDDGFLSGDYRGDVDLDAVLNARNSPVFAAWFTGVLRMPQGKMLEYVHGGFGSLQERDLILSIESGVVARRWMLNYIPAFFAEKPEEARETYSLIAVTPRLRPGAAERTLRYLANPFADNYAAAVSAIFLDEMSSLWVQLFMLSDLIKVAIRAALLDELGDGEVLSEKDRAARCEYDKTVEAFERALTIAGNILRGEQPAALSIPNKQQVSAKIESSRCQNLMSSTTTTPAKRWSGAQKYIKLMCTRGAFDRGTAVPKPAPPGGGPKK